MRRQLALLPMALGIVLVLPTGASAIPAWARKYNVACSVCHYPVPPRLNGTGLRFRWQGYRMPDDFGKQVDVTQVSNYLAARGRIQYHYDKVEGQAPDESSFSMADASLFYGGPFGTRYAGFFEIEHKPGAFNILASVQGAWGIASQYAGLRVGQMHWGPQAGVAGFDRAVGIAAPNVLSRPLTSAIAFAFPETQLGAEGFIVKGRNRFSVSALNGVDSAGSSTGEDRDTWKDVAMTDQFLLDDDGSGALVMGYYGTSRYVVTGLTGQAHFWRVAATANKIFHNVEVLGGGVYGRDHDLPVGQPSPFASSQNDAYAFWFSGQYYRAGTGVAYARYERMDPSTDATDDASTRWLGGIVVPLGVPQYLRLTLEYWLDLPQYRVQKRTHHIAGEVRLVF